MLLQQGSCSSLLLVVEGGQGHLCPGLIPDQGYICPLLTVFSVMLLSCYVEGCS